MELQLPPRRDLGRAIDDATGVAVGEVSVWKVVGDGIAEASAIDVVDGAGNATEIACDTAKDVEMLMDDGAGTDMMMDGVASDVSSTGTTTDAETPSSSVELGMADDTGVINVRNVDEGVVSCADGNDADPIAEGSAISDATEVDTADA